MFKKGNTYGKGRPVGSQNKLSKANREFLHHILFDQEQFIQDWISLDLNGRMELRTRLAPYILPKPSVSEDVQRDLPLFIDDPDPPAVNIYKKFGLDPKKLKDPYEFDFREWGKNMREKNEKEESIG